MMRTVVLTGARGAGKTALLRRFCASEEPSKPYCYFLSPDVPAGGQRLALAERILAALPVPGAGAAEIASSWESLLSYLTDASLARPDTGAGRFVLILDEFERLLEQSSELPGVLGEWQEREKSRLPLFLVLCGSHTSVMGRLAEPAEPLHGVLESVVEIPPLRLDEVAMFYNGHVQYTPLNILTMYSVLGGSARRHALVDPERPMAAQIVDLVLRPGGPLATDIERQLGSGQVRERAAYNAVLGALASGIRQYGQILESTEVDRGSLRRVLQVLMNMSWVRRDLPFGQGGNSGDRLAQYRIADPFLVFWYRFAAPWASDLEFSDPARVYKERIEPALTIYAQSMVFEEACRQWVLGHGGEHLGLGVSSMGGYWNRSQARVGEAPARAREDPIWRIDIAAKLSDGTFLIAECKASLRHGKVGMEVYNQLVATAAAIRGAAGEWGGPPHLIIFSTSGFAPELEAVASNADNQLRLVGLAEVLSPQQGQPPAAK